MLGLFRHFFVTRLKLLGFSPRFLGAGHSLAGSKTGRVPLQIFPPLTFRPCLYVSNPPKSCKQAPQPAETLLCGFDFED